MHAVFRVDEIFSTVLNFIYLDSPLSTLSAIARTCKTFQDPALDVLWQNQTSLSPVLRCFSGAVVQRFSVDGNIIHDISTLPPDDMSRLRSTLVCLADYIFKTVLLT